MSEQKKEFSTSCLVGFLLSFLSPGLMILLNKVFSEGNVLYWILFVALLLAPLVGFIVSIVGLVTAKKNNRTGKGFGVAGIVLPSIYAVIVLIVVLLGAALLSLFTKHETDKRIPTFYTDSEIVAVRYYYGDSIDGYRVEELDEDRIDEFVDDLNSMDLVVGGAMDYYWDGHFGIEMELDNGTFMTYDGTRLETLRVSRVDEDFTVDDELKSKSDFVFVTNYDFWEVMNDYFPSIEEYGDNVHASQTTFSVGR